MEKSTIKRIIECAAGSCASFATGVVLGRFMPEGGLTRKVIFSIGSALIGGVVGDMVSNSSAVTEVSNVVANSFGTSKDDILEEATDEVSQDTSELRNCFDDEVKEESTNEAKEEVTEETGEDGYVYSKPTAPSFVKTMENLYSGMEILLTFLTSKRLIRLLKVKKPLSVMTTVLFTYVIVAWFMERTKVDVYYGNSSNKEAIA